jgi:hypothetical protein
MKMQMRKPVQIAGAEFSMVGAMTGIRPRIAEVGWSGKWYLAREWRKEVWAQLAADVGLLENASLFLRPHES